MSITPELRGRRQERRISVSGDMEDWEFGTLIDWTGSLVWLKSHRYISMSQSSSEWVIRVSAVSVFDTGRLQNYLPDKILYSRVSYKSGISNFVANRSVFLMKADPIFFQWLRVHSIDPSIWIFTTNINLYNFQKYIFFDVFPNCRNREESFIRFQHRHNQLQLWLSQPCSHPDGDVDQHLTF